MALPRVSKLKSQAGTVLNERFPKLMHKRREFVNRNRLELATARQPQSWQHSRPVPTGLYSRLDEATVNRIHESLTPEQAATVAAAQNDADIKTLLIAYGMHHSVSGVAEQTELTAITPPTDVHAMARGDLAAAGSLTISDLVLAAYTEATAEQLSTHATVLDFGCSSGRTLMPIKALRSDLNCIGCDPNQGAVQWASQNLPQIEFFTSPQEPPLALADDSVDFAYAISIWSHFEAEAAKRWLTEMRRVIKPGGHLLITTHGWWSLRVNYEWHAQGSGTVNANGYGIGIITKAQMGMAKNGTWFFPAFGDTGDWGVKAPTWGASFFTADWIASNVSPEWSIRLFREGALEGNQDVYVLQRCR